MRQGTTRAREIRAAERRAYVVHLRAQGLNYRAIAAAVHRDPQWRTQIHRSYGPRHAHHDVMKALEQQQAAMAEEIAQARTLELARLDSLQVRLWGRAMQGELPAVDGVLRIMERRAKLLGLDAPTKLAPRPQAPPALAEMGMTEEELNAVAMQLAAFGRDMLAHQHRNGAEETP